MNCEQRGLVRLYVAGLVLWTVTAAGIAALIHDWR